MKKLTTLALLIALSLNAHAQETSVVSADTQSSGLAARISVMDDKIDAVKISFATVVENLKKEMDEMRKRLVGDVENINAMASINAQKLNNFEKRIQELEQQTLLQAACNEEGNTMKNGECVEDTTPTFEQQLVEILARCQQGEFLASNGSKLYCAQSSGDKLPTPAFQNSTNIGSASGNCPSSKVLADKCEIKLKAGNSGQTQNGECRSEASRYYNNACTGSFLCSGGTWQALTKPTCSKERKP